MNPLKLYKKHQNSPKATTAPISYYNFWEQEPDVIWFTDFIRSRGFLQKYPKAEFAFFSTLGKIQSVFPFIMVRCKIPNPMC